MTLPIDRGVPVPPEGQRGQKQVYPWADMEDGDSFAVVIKRDAAHTQNSVRCSWNRFCARHGDRGLRLVTRRDPIGNVVRAWLVQIVPEERGNDNAPTNNDNPLCDNDNHGKSEVVTP